MTGIGSGALHLSVAVEGYQMTAQGLRKLGSGTVEVGGGTGLGAAPPLAVLVATGNPLGLIVSSGIKVYEWFAPQKPNGEPDPARGIRQFVVGTGGIVIASLPARPSRTAKYGTTIRTAFSRSPCIRQATSGSSFRLKDRPLRIRERDSATSLT
ncbi:MAG: hypothetical protein K8F29_00625 [Kofleriaceae bacterium]|nr:hypothetical protein [Candidatus Methylomirabilis lanthanidiphila]